MTILNLLKLNWRGTYD